jgi:hypothetical protein
MTAPEETTLKKARVIELIAEGRAIRDACVYCSVAPRTFRNWYQRDENFTASLVVAMGDRPLPPRRKVNVANTPRKKAHVLELIAEGRTIKDSCRVAEVAPRTFDAWRQRDEKFATGYARAMEERRDGLVDKLMRIVNDDEWNEHDRLLALFFLTKQADPSFRDNHKVEHVVSGGLQGALKAFAKLGRADA